ncbi:hypothetical protein BGX28_007181 [Mortierella sp. GBA30]|nr:hypothetical protein BGX28_007181 [Mortierella sp. GBA30]
MGVGKTSQSCVSVKSKARGMAKACTMVLFAFILAGKVTAAAFDGTKHQHQPQVERQQYVDEDIRKEPKFKDVVSDASPNSGINKRYSHPASPLNHFLTPGAFFSPPCSRIGLASASPFRARNTLIHNLQCSQIGTEKNLELTHKQQQPISPRRRTFSNFSGKLQQAPQQQQQQSATLLFQPILDLLAVSTTTFTGSHTVDTKSCQSFGPDVNQVSPTWSNEDLPSPVYCNYSSGDDGDSINGRDESKISSLFPSNTPVPLGYATELSTAFPFKNKDPLTNVHTDAFIQSRSTSELITLESGLKIKGGAIASSGEVIDTPLLDLQEQGYVLIGRSHCQEYKRMTPVLSVITALPKDNRQAENVLTLSPMLDERYWQPSVSVEDFGAHQTLKGLEDVVAPSEMKMSTPNVTMQSELDPLGLAAHELRKLERQVEQEVDILTKASSSLRNSETESLENAEVIYVDYDRLLTAHVEEDLEYEKYESEKSLWRRLWSSSGLNLDLTFDLELDGTREDIAMTNNLLTLPALPESPTLPSSTFNLSTLPPVPGSPALEISELSIGFRQQCQMPPLPLSPELGMPSRLAEQHGQDIGIPFTSLHPFLSLPPSPVQTWTRERSAFIASDFVPSDLLPPLPASPELAPQELSIITNPLLCLPPLPPSSIEEAYTPRSLEIATTRAQLRYWSQTAARLRDQEQVLTARIDMLVQEMAEMLDKCQETELGLQAKETIVQQLRRELAKEQEFGFASVQEAVLSIHEKQILEKALEESWKELDLLRQAWIHQQGALSVPEDDPESKMISAFAEMHSTTSSTTTLHGELTANAMVTTKNTSHRPTLTFFQSLVKLFCLVLISTVALVSTILLLYGQQHHLHQAYDILIRYLSKINDRYDVKFTLRQLKGLVKGIFDPLRLLLRMKQKAAEDQVRSTAEMLWGAAQLLADMGMNEIRQSFQMVHTWS